MYLKRRRYFPYVIFVTLLVACKVVVALEFQPGAGVAVEYTDNAELTPENPVDELITVGYVGASIAESEGSLIYSATSSLNKQTYSHDTFDDQRYFSLEASADWEMIRDRFNWSMTDTFSQRTINILNSNTPDNLQDSNVFVLGADIWLPVSERQSFSLAPVFSQYYFEELPTNNRQYSLSANWNYQMFRLASVGLSFNTREIDYFEQLIADTTFTTMAVVFSGQRASSEYTLNLGSTNVERDLGEETSGFSGSADWLVNLSSRSTFNTSVVTELTDSSTVAAGESLTAGDVQVTADVIRNRTANMTYQRKGVSLQTTIAAEYSKVDYSESPLDQVARSIDMQFDYPLTRLLSSSFYTSYSRIKRLERDRLDERYTLGGSLEYRFSRKLSGSFDLKYRKKESTFDAENFDEYSVYASLVYGFGEVFRPTRAGGF